MKKFIFVTTEGETISPNGRNVENLQVIGVIQEVNNEDEALKKLMQENLWIFDTEFNVADFIAYEIL